MGLYLDADNCTINRGTSCIVNQALSFRLVQKVRFAAATAVCPGGCRLGLFANCTFVTSLSELALSYFDVARLFKDQPGYR